MSATDLFVTGTDTNVGKTVLSALLCAALDRTYWKPVQTGTSEDSDRDAVCRYAGLPVERTLPEVYRFAPPVSPHLAARLSDTQIDLNRIARPQNTGPLVIEGAGGALVPLNETALMVDLMRLLGAPVLIASRTSLGTINHTLLTIEGIKSRRILIKGVVMIGPENMDNRDAIEHYGCVPVLGTIPTLSSIDRRSLCEVFAERFDRMAFA